MLFDTLFRFVNRHAPHPPVRRTWRGTYRPRQASCRLTVDALDHRFVPATLSVSDATLLEGHAGAQFAEAVVTLSEPVTKAVTVNYHTAAGTATADSDYDAVSGKLSFALGETTKTILVPVRGDRLAEPDETFVIKLAAAKNAKITGGTGVVTIHDDEPRLTINDVSLIEGNCRCGGGTAFTFTVSLSAAYDEAISIAYATADGTATVANEDYVATSGVLTFAPGETTHTFTVWVYGETTAEATEYFFVNLGGASSNASVADGQGTGLILNDDGGTGTDPDPCTVYCCNPLGCGLDNQFP